MVPQCCVCSTDHAHKESQGKGRGEKWRDTLIVLLFNNSNHTKSELSQSRIGDNLFKHIIFTVCGCFEFLKFIVNNNTPTNKS